MSAPETALGPVSRKRAAEILQRFPGVRILIVGDLMLDHFVFGQVHRISPEAPVPVVEFDREEFRIGGAGNVAHNVRTLGGSADVIGAVGNDEPGARVLEALGAQGIGVGGVVVEAGRPTTRKMRIVTSRHLQVARIDYESDREVDASVEAQLLSALEAAVHKARAVVISDYLKGSVTRALVARAVGLARDAGIPVLVDPKIPHLDYYSGVALITPNQAEAEAATHTRIRTTTDARAAARTIRNRLACATVLITRGEAGMWLLDDQAEGSLAAATREVADVTGAGDTVIGALSLALAAGADVVEAAMLANAAAGVAVGKFGPAGVTIDELLNAL